MKKIFLLITFIVPVLLTACGGGSGSENSSENGSNSGGGNTSGLASIVSFNVTGTGAKNQKGQVPINPHVNDGKWKIDWEINLKDGATVDFFNVKIYASEDNKLSATDPNIYTALCNGSRCLGKTKISLSCLHDSNSRPNCEDDLVDGFFDKYILEPFLKTLPKSAYMIFTVGGGDALTNDKLKDQVSVPVIFE